MTTTTTALPAVLRRWCRALLLPLLLLISQQGAFLHALGHLDPAHDAAHGHGHAHAPADAHAHALDHVHDHPGVDAARPAGSDDPDDEGACSLCLAFAGLNTVALPASLAPLLLADLCHACVAAPAATALALAGLGQRNRGPPARL